jgi:hypothetical protein
MSAPVHDPDEIEQELNSGHEQLVAIGSSESISSWCAVPPK